ncbi:hypothetical protein [Conexibacter sp. S30A1]|uniref:hypothetical protein n=1 Tax=Conexibacter sp. S30A1 TaxID=2937800 RepID=UPI00200D2F25|nr:hypothetical protein [Conexibacter sp. S30A1]
MRSDEDGGSPDWDEAKEYCRKAGLVGVGWGFSRLRDNARLATVISACNGRKGWSQGAATIRRLAEDVEDGDLMWTRDGLGRYWLAQINGPWRYDKSPLSVKYDLYNVRPACWLKTSWRDFEVPGAVVRSFTGPGQSLRRIGDHPAAIRITEMLWEAETRGGNVVASFTPEEAIREIFDPTDIEDLVLLSLQAAGWVLIPSSRLHDTPVYEAALRRPGSGKVAVVSVKSGPDNHVDMRALRDAAGSAKAFAYSTHNRYEGKQDGITKITTRSLTAFMSEHPELLPPRIERWLRL